MSIKIIRHVLKLVILLACLCLPALVNFPVSADTSSVSVPSLPIRESDDYATMVLGDPWDMDRFKDISMYFNESGQRYVSDTVNFSNGIYSARSVDRDPQSGWFHVLFPGYQDTVHSGKVGSRYPIDSRKYQCLFIAMRPETASANDWFRVMWFANDRLTGSSFGQTNWLKPYPENPSNPAAAWKWKVYRINLPQESITATPYTSWSSQNFWQGLRIDPTMFGRIPYGVDWVRLTNCQAVNAAITFTPNSSIKAVWVRPEGTTRYIRVADNVNGNSGSYSLDTQGLQAGNYTVGFGALDNCCITESQNLLKIQTRPRAKFERPSFWSGDDYATSSGDPWDFSNPADVASYSGISAFSYQDGMLSITTNSSNSASQVADPILNLNGPVPADPSQYRYLTVKIHTSWKAIWQNVPDGMMMRWVWSVQGSSGRPGFRCNLVSQDIPFDTDWDTITVDLHDAFAGSAEQVQGECSGYPPKWLTSRPVLGFRLDPNENITTAADPITGGGPFYQLIDWVRLTKPDTVARGQSYPIQINIESSPDDLTTLELYYTTNRANPTANLIYSKQLSQSNPEPGPIEPESPLLPNLTARVYLPAIMTPLDFAMQGQSVSYLWNTTNVAPGSYYICTVLTNSTGTTTWCSEATVQVR